MMISFTHSRRVASRALFLGLAVLGCDKPPVSLRLESTRYETTPGQEILLSLSSEGGLERAEWQVGAALPADCKGSVRADEAHPEAAVFRAPESCAATRVENNVMVTGYFSDGRTATTSSTIRTTFDGAPRSPAPEKAPAEMEVAAPADDELPSIVPVFAKTGETYFDFSDAGFRVRHELAADHISILLSAPRRGGFGGSCVEASGGAVDLRQQRSMTVELEGTGHGRLEVKLEQPQSGALDGQHILTEVALPTTGRKTLSLPLASVPPALQRSVKRICFATTAPKLASPSYELRVKVYSVHFSE